jgi:hypothetical protein
VRRGAGGNLYLPRAIAVDISRGATILLLTMRNPCEARLFRSAILFGTILTALAAGQPARAAETTLSGAQLRALFAGGLEYSVEALRTRFVFRFKANGDWTAEQPGGQEAWGVWEFDGNKICRTSRGPTEDPTQPFDPWREFNLRPTCFTVTCDGDRLVAHDLEAEMVLYTNGALARLAPPRAIPVAPPAPAASPAAAPQIAAPVARLAAPNDEALRLERERLALERDRLAATQAENEQRLAAEKRELEKMRIDLERQQLQREREAMLALRSQPQAVVAAGGRDTVPPFIDAPVMLETTSDTLVISGSAMDNGRLTRIEMNGADVAFNARDGRFSIQTGVPVGKSSISITAFDSEGNKAEHLVTVVRSRDIPRIEFGSYHALVIGIDEYETLPKLKTAVADARSVARTLEENYGYKVRLLENATRSDIIDALDEMRERLNEDDNLLIYYAGHGWRDDQNGRGYWLPAGARADRRSNWFSNASLTDALQAMLAKHVMVVADSCYSGTLTRSAIMTARSPDYIARMAEKRARVVLSSGGLEPVSDAGGGKHSIFAQQFLQALAENEGVLDGTQLFEKVRHKVVLNANQTPEYSDIRLAGHEGGDFLFVRRE